MNPEIQIGAKHSVRDLLRHFRSQTWGDRILNERNNRSGIDGVKSKKVKSKKVKQSP
jgi:hypothetical protein